MSNKNIEKTQTLTQDIKQLIHSARDRAVRSVDFERVRLYWNLGQRIVEEEQGGEERAEYGKQLIRNLSKELEPLYGSGYSVRQLELMRQFYGVFPNTNTLCSQLNWTQVCHRYSNGFIVMYNTKIGV